MPDKLSEVAKTLGQTKRNAEQALKRYQAKHPKIERVRDVFDSTIPFEMEFDTYPNDTLFRMDLFFNKPPPLRACSGRYGMLCIPFTVDSGDHLLQVTARYKPGSVVAFRNSIKLTSGVEYYEYDPAKGLVWVQGLPSSSVINICYVIDTWITCEGEYTLNNFTYAGNVAGGLHDPSAHTNEKNNAWYSGPGAPDPSGYNDVFLFNHPILTTPIPIDNFRLSFTINTWTIDRLTNNTDSSGVDCEVRVFIYNTSNQIIAFWHLNDGRQYNNGPDFFIPHGASSFVWQKRYIQTPTQIMEPDEFGFSFGNINPQSLSGTYYMDVSSIGYTEYTPYGGLHTMTFEQTGFNPSHLVNRVQFQIGMEVDPGVPLQADQFEIMVELSDLTFGCSRKQDGTVG